MVRHFYISSEAPMLSVVNTGQVGMPGLELQHAPMARWLCRHSAV